MRFRAILNIKDTIAGHVWPDGIPLPVPGDNILITIDNRSYGATITSRLYSIGMDPTSGKPLAELHLESEPAAVTEEAP